MNALKNRTQTIVEGEVVHGRQIGRTIGFPTANVLVSVENEFDLPKGVYGVRVYHEDTYYHGVMNIGMRPTFKDEKGALSCEVHILDFNQDIYGKRLMVDILFFIREEQAFSSVDQLVQQLHRDVDYANKRFRFFNKE